MIKIDFLTVGRRDLRQNASCSSLEILSRMVLMIFLSDLGNFGEILDQLRLLSKLSLTVGPE